VVQDVKANQTAVQILIPSVPIRIGLCLLHFVIETRYSWMRGSRQGASHEVIFGHPGLILLTRHERRLTIGSALLSIAVHPDIVRRRSRAACPISAGKLSLSFY
jgi:hypothetical protein